MALNLQSLSLTSVFNSIVGFFRSQENSGSWKNLTTGSEATFLIRLLANVISTISYRIIAQSRENFLSTAALPSSNIGISVNLGYSAFRGSNFKRKVRLLPTGSYTIPKLGVLGAYNDQYDIIALEEVSLVEGEPIDVNVVVGKIKEESFTAGTSAIKCFSLFTTGISEDYVLYVGSTEVPTTKVIKNMTEDKYLVRTNPYSSVDIMYLNTYEGAKYVYGTGTEITIKYVELQDIEEVPFTDAMFANFAILEDVTNISQYLPFETVEEMKINAPLDHETQNLIRSKQDYANRLSEIVPAVIDANWEALTPTYTLITGLKNDFTLVSDSERAEVLTLLKKENFFGTPLPDITHPRREVANLQIDLALNVKYKNLADINEDIDNILANYYDAKLGYTFNTFDLERKIESLSYVKYARVGHVINEREANKNYQVGYILNYKDENSNTSQNYIAAKILGMTGDVAPNWNIPITPMKEIDTEMETQDGSIIWRAYKNLPNMPSNSYSAWQRYTQFGVGDYVYDEKNAPGYMFKCVDLVKSSGLAEPDISLLTIGQFVQDGGIVWVVKERSTTYPDWASMTNYRLGSSVNVASSSEYSLECISYTGTVGTDENVNFELTKYEATVDSTDANRKRLIISGNKTFYFRTDDIISVTYFQGMTEVTDTYVVDVTTYNAVEGKTSILLNKAIPSGVSTVTITTTERGTRDGQILWKLIDDVDNITYPWNGYMVFDHVLNILN